MSRIVALAVWLGCAVSVSIVSAQPPTACDGRACTPEDFRAGVNQLHELKNDFIAALRQFAEAAAGAYGDEGPRLRTSLDAAQRSLEGWDAAIARYESAARTATPTADLHVALGTVYLDRLRARDALRELASADRLDPHRSDVHELSAAAYVFVGDAQGAHTEIDRAHAIDAATAVAAPTRAALLRQAAGVAPIFPPALYVDGFRHLERGELAEGLALLRAAVPRDAMASALPSGTSVLAGARLRQGQLQAALTELRLASAPDDAETRRVTGTAYWADEQYDKSIQALTAAIELNPRDERARVALADVFVSADRQADAARALAGAVELMPDSGQAHYRLGQLAQAASRIPDAIREYEAAVACAPLVGLDRLFDVIGGLYATQADFTRAAGTYYQRVEVNPTNAEAHRKLADIYALKGASDAALAEYAAAQRLSPGDAGAFTGAAQVALRLGRFAEAANAARQALALDAAQQKARFALGTALMRLGNTQAGQRELSTFQQQLDESAAQRRQAFEVATLVSDGARAQAAGSYEDAARLFERALESGADAAVEGQVAAALWKAGRPADALAHLMKALDVSPGDAELHKLTAEVYAALGSQNEREREEQTYRRLLAQRKERRLAERPLLR
jgi:tetratricopeptide (TPR) repeat protein